MKLLQLSVFCVSAHVPSCDDDMMMPNERINVCVEYLDAIAFYCHDAIFKFQFVLNSTVQCRYRSSSSFNGKIQQKNRNQDLE